MLKEKAAPLTRNGEATVELVWTMQFVGAIGAELTLAADPAHPLDAESVALLPRIIYSWAHCRHDPSAFVAWNALCRLLQFDTHRRILVI